MERDSGSWYSNFGTWYYFDIGMTELTQHQIPQDYEEYVDSAGRCGRFRYCHALLDRHDNPDSTKLCHLLCKSLFEQCSKFTPWEHEIHEGFKGFRESEIFNYLESICRDERNKNINKFLIVVKFGVFTRSNNALDYDDYDYYDIDEEELGFVPASESSIEALEKVSDLSLGFRCAVCLEEEKEEVKRMPCRHVFHAQCIQQWLANSHLCPLCRHAMPSVS
ncbi:hypothetical protein Gogos_016281 [Gossypium gossypioides]|uniref:RING-type E3 ubiquitin transferase n=1 Tax=Gossypium gossypioides TaxID=34282 RepID=A0A7J9B978_GOSGO|nr:hypothetical protein [Gossypium gossypioides]